jgi:transposase
MSANVRFQATSDIATSLDGCMPPVIQGSKLEPRTMRYELNDYEWRVIKSMLPNKPRGVPRVDDRCVLNGEAHDNRLCSVLLDGLRPQTIVLADRGYDADWIRQFVSEQGAWANLPPKKNRTNPINFSPDLYRSRNLVERFFHKIKQCRRIATRYDKLAANYLAFIKLLRSGSGYGLMSQCPSPRSPPAAASRRLPGRQPWANRRGCRARSRLSHRPPWAPEASLRAAHPAVDRPAHRG